MNTLTRSHSNDTPPALSPEGPALRRPNERRSVRARMSATLFATGFVAAVAACQGSSEPSATTIEHDSIGNIEQELSIATCRQGLNGCLSNAGGASDLGQCTLDFQGCFTQAALDRVGQGQRLAECRVAADDCISSTIDDVSGIRACGAVLGACADDVLAETRNGFRLVSPIVSRVLDVGVRAVRGLVGVVDGLPAIALGTVRTCRARVSECVDSAASDLDIGACADDLDRCVDDVVTLIDPALDALPGPSPSDVLTGTLACRSSAKDCLVGALNLSDVSVCGDLLGSCVDDATALLEATVDDVNVMVDPLAVPANVVDCTLELTQCLAALGNPFDCARQAQICATP
jgi:hypothetical protein